MTTEVTAYRTKKLVIEKVKRSTSDGHYLVITAQQAGADTEIYIFGETEAAPEVRLEGFNEPARSVV